VDGLTLVSAANTLDALQTLRSKWRPSDVKSILTYQLFVTASGPARQSAYLSFVALPSPDLAPSGGWLDALTVVVQGLHQRQPAVPFHKHKLTMLLRDLCVSASDYSFVVACFSLSFSPLFLSLSLSLSLSMPLCLFVFSCNLRTFFLFLSLHGVHESVFVAHISPLLSHAQQSLAVAAFASYLGEIRKKVLCWSLRLLCFHSVSADEYRHRSSLLSCVFL